MPPKPPASHTISIPVAAQPASPWRWQRKSHPHRGDRKLSSKAPSSALSHSSAPGSADALLAAPCLPPPLAHLHPRGPKEEEDGEQEAGSSTPLWSPPLSRPPITPRDAPASAGVEVKLCRGHRCHCCSTERRDIAIPPALTRGVTPATRSSTLPRELLEAPAGSVDSSPPLEEMSLSPTGSATSAPVWDTGWGCHAASPARTD